MPGDLVECTQDGQISYLSGEIPVECVRYMPVSLTATKGSGTVRTGSQWEPAQVEPLGAQPFQEGSQPQLSSQNQTQFTCPLRLRENTYHSVAAHQHDDHPGEGNSLLEKRGRLSQRHAAQIDMVSVTSAVTLTRTSADIRVGAIEHLQIPYPRILMDWVASPLRETQSRPRPLQRKVPTTVNSFHRACFCRGE